MAYYPFVYATDEEGTPSEEVNDKDEATELLECGILSDETMIWSDDHPMDGWTEWLRCKGGFGFEGEDADGDGIVDADEQEEEGADFYTELQYADEDGSPSAEIDTSDVPALIEDGTIDDETMVWTEGMDDWMAWGEVKAWFGFEEDAAWDPAQVEEWLNGMNEEALTEYCQEQEMELDDWSEDAMRTTLLSMYGGGEADDAEAEVGDVETLVYEQANGDYSDETSLSDAWELWKIQKVICDDTMVWAEGFDDWTPFGQAKYLLFGKEELGEDAEEEEVEKGEPPETAENGFEETPESLAFRAKLQAMRPYQVKAECKKRRMPHEGQKEALIEALIMMEYGGGKDAANEMAAAAVVDADIAAAIKKAVTPLKQDGEKLQKQVDSLQREVVALKAEVARLSRLSGGVAPTGSDTTATISRRRSQQ